MISSFPCSSITENATCTGSSGEFCFVKWTSFTLRVSCSCDCTGMSSLLVPCRERPKMLRDNQSGFNLNPGCIAKNCGYREFQTHPGEDVCLGADFSGVCWKSSR